MASSRWRARSGCGSSGTETSEIVRAVHGHGAEFIVTLRGEPVAVIRPLTEKNGRELLQAEEDEALAEVDRLAEKIARAWRSPKSALELLEEQRR